jgi:membrane protein insertase Oxa1/YidC/SpoIIIJ
LLEQQEFMTNNGASPLKVFKYIALQAPLFILAFAGLNYFVAHYPELAATGGAWWFENLTISDPYYRLPLLTASGVLVGFEVPTY